MIIFFFFWSLYIFCEAFFTFFVAVKSKLKFVVVFCNFMVDLFVC